MLKGKQELAKYEVELENLNSKERKLFNMFTEGIVTEEQIRNMLIDHKLKKEEISKKILTLKMTEVSEESMKELGNSILSQLFNDLASKNLSNGLYESLLVEADITATIFRDRVEFHTKYGDVTVPRMWISNRPWMPSWEIELRNKGTEEDSDIYINEKTKITVTYKTGTKAVLAKFGQLKIKSV